MNTNTGAGWESIDNIRKQRRPELLSPAGDYACFQAAIKAGADAVYLGGRQFGARAFAGNFTDEELLEALKEAHFWGRKIYLTVNTLLKQEELQQLPGYLETFYLNGLDGIIIQDMGVLKLCRDYFPGLELHASTQMTVTDVRAALELKELGIDRVVPARELSLTEMSEIRRLSGLEVEAFIHGSMCYSYSGQCLFSSLLGGRSGNRGRCAQPCRQPYRMNCGGQISGECYPLSLKDMCTIDFLPELIAAGIDSFKIEGIMKRPEYVAGVTSVYRRYIDQYLQSKEIFPVQPSDIMLLSSLYIRSEIAEGYYHRHNGTEMITLEQPGYAGCDEAVLDRIRAEFLDREMTRPVRLRIVLKKGEPAELEAISGEYAITVTGQPVQMAMKRPLSEEDIQKQLTKTGGSGFLAEQVVIDKEQDIFMPVSVLNELRREALKQLRTLISSAACMKRSAVVYRKPAPSDDSSSAAGRQLPFHVSIADFFQLKAVINRADTERVYIPADLLIDTVPDWIADLITIRSGEHKEYFITLPPVIRQADEAYLHKVEKLLNRLPFTGVRISSLSQYRWLKELNHKRSRTAAGSEHTAKPLSISLDHRCYIWNQESLYAYPEADTWCTPLEMNRKAVYSLAKKVNNRYGYPELMVYGRIPMMTTANCLRKTSGACIRDTNAGMKKETVRGLFSEVSLLDRYKVAFPVEINCRHCYNVIYNSVPLSLHDYMNELKGKFSPCFVFTDEDPKQVSMILDQFADLTDIAGSDDPPTAVHLSYTYTTGHFKKGAQ